MKKIIVACGSGVATSQTVASKITKLLKERKVPAEVEAVDIKSLKHHIKKVPMLMYRLLKLKKNSIFQSLTELLS